MHASLIVQFLNNHQPHLRMFLPSFNRRASIDLRAIYLLYRYILVLFSSCITPYVILYAKIAVANLLLNRDNVYHKVHKTNVLINTQWTNIKHCMNKNVKINNQISLYRRVVRVCESNIVFKNYLPSLLINSNYNRNIPTRFQHVL